MVSVIIPSYKDPHLVTTIKSLIASAMGEIEIIPVLDGYWRHDLPEDTRIRVIHLGKNRGMRDAINAGVRIARGEYIMRTDEHCLFAPGYDTELSGSCQDNWIMTATRYFLDPTEWRLMNLPPVNYEKLVIQGDVKFAGRPWRERDEERKDVLIDETMAMQGSMWLMKKSWWETIGELQTEGYGPLYQDSHEMIFKTWKLGGKMMLNKRTWYAHKHRSFKRTHQNGTPENKHTQDNWLYSLNTWRDYYEQEVRPQWGI